MVFTLLTWVFAVEAGEVLGHIAEENELAAENQLEAPAKNGEKIIYRVICSPGDEPVPDCEKPPLSDQYDGEQPTAVQTPEFPPEQQTEEELKPAASPTVVKKVADTGKPPTKKSLKTPEKEKAHRHKSLDKKPTDKKGSSTGKAKTAHKTAGKSTESNKVSRKKHSGK